jgi:bifunctional non-homologous end joining protein LigD
VWDTGTWTPESPDIAAALKKGDLKFQLHGKKLRGSWVLVRTHGYGSSSGKSWLLIKHRDEFASTEDIVTTEPKSAVSKRLLVDIARDAGGDVEKAATGDPNSKSQAAKAVERKAPSKKAVTKKAAAAGSTKTRRKS